MQFEAQLNPLLTVDMAKKCTILPITKYDLDYCAMNISHGGDYLCKVMFKTFLIDLLSYRMDIKCELFIFEV